MLYSGQTTPATVPQQNLRVRLDLDNLASDTEQQTDPCLCSHAPWVYISRMAAGNTM
jgi:hypothetical protein